MNRRVYPSGYLQKLVNTQVALFLPASPLSESEIKSSAALM